MFFNFLFQADLASFLIRRAKQNFAVTNYLFWFIRLEAFHEGGDYEGSCTLASDSFASFADHYNEPSAPFDPQSATTTPPFLANSTNLQSSSHAYMAVLPPGKADIEGNVGGTASQTRRMYRHVLQRLMTVLENVGCLSL
ncbi:unnamed protein product [Protopolystoma xenopodis]|uniref:Uncharacterized protein n=1 Tax=Protopolystoma xenopodis TaxID=117903 RepID=A0A3S5B6Z0_9PLAT|nr:unnamed protein product [Protopolystoma xenopodis]